MGISQSVGINSKGRESLDKDFGRKVSINGCLFLCFVNVFNVLILIVCVETYIRYKRHVRPVNTR